MKRTKICTACAILTLGVATVSTFSRPRVQTAPSSYTAYTGTDPKPIPPAPVLGPANSFLYDPTFGKRILRVTDQNTNEGESLISIDAGFFRAWNANSTAIKLTGPHGDGYWLEFNPDTFKVGDGSSHPIIHPLSFGARWEWSAIDPDIMYFLHGNQIAAYNKSTGVTRDLGGPPNGDPVAYFAVVVGQDKWVCAAAGSGYQDTFTKIFCVDPTNPEMSTFIDVVKKTINGVPQNDPNWPTSGVGMTIGIHSISGGTGASWLEVTFHGQSWGANGGTVFNLATNTWSLVTNADFYWSGHVSMGNGKYVNAAGSIGGQDSRGYLVRNPDHLMNSSDYFFIAQPPAPPNRFCDSEHSSWLNSMTNPNAPLLSSRFLAVPPCQFAWAGEIIAAAVDGSNRVWRFAHNHSTGSCYYGEGFAQISNDGSWALLSSYWDGQLGDDFSFECSKRIDTFIVELSPSPPAIAATSLPDGIHNVRYVATVPATGGVPPSYTWSITAGTLPAGLVLKPSNGVITGIPTEPGMSTFTVQVVDAAAQTSTATLSITILAKMK
jgi:Putative Ig domain